MSLPSLECSHGDALCREKEGMHRHVNTQVCTLQGSQQEPQSQGLCQGSAAIAAAAQGA